MIGQELELVAALDAAGLDFRTPVVELAARNGMKDNWGVAKHPYVPVHCAQGLAGLSGEWKIFPTPMATIVLPALSYHFEFHPHADNAEANHQDALALLQQHFGKGTEDSASNTFSCRWKIGYFTVRVTTWPLAKNRQYTNIYSGLNPYLYAAANITISVPTPAHLWAEPLSIEELRRHAAERSQCWPGGWLVPQPYFARRNRQTVTAALQADETLAWTLPEGLVVCNQVLSAAVPRSQMAGLELLRMESGRFQGFSELQLVCDLGHGYRVPLKIVVGSEPTTLDRVAVDLAGTYGLSLSYQEDKNDY